jgi:hypothetical protein
MAKYLVTVAEEVYYTYEIESEFPQAPDVFKWNPEAVELRDIAMQKPIAEAVGVTSEFIDYLDIEEV